MSEQRLPVVLLMKSAVTQIYPAPAHVCHTEAGPHPISGAAELCVFEQHGAYLTWICPKCDDGYIILSMDALVANTANKRAILARPADQHRQTPLLVSLTEWLRRANSSITEQQIQQCVQAAV